jgi:hypothetical protein
VSTIAALGAGILDFAELLFEHSGLFNRCARARNSGTSFFWGWQRLMDKQPRRAIGPLWREFIAAVSNIDHY